MQITKYNYHVKLLLLSTQIMVYNFYSYLIHIINEKMCKYKKKYAKKTRNTKINI